MSAQHDHTNIEAAALAYARRGWPVVLLDGKRPVHKDWTTRATTDERAILAWLASRPGANIGIATGRAGFFVLDVDGEAGEASLRALVAERGPLPKTLEAWTGGGGRHLLYQMPDGPPLGNTTGKLGAHLDTRGQGGQIVVEPSVHPETGAQYEWVTSPETTPIAVAPAWLVSLLRTQPASPAAAAPIVDIDDARATRYGLAALASASAELAAIKAGGRNDALNRAAFKAGQLAGSTGLTEAQAEDALREAARTNGLLKEDGEAQFRKTFRSGWDRGLRSPRFVPAAESRPAAAPRKRATVADDVPFEEGPYPLEPDEDDEDRDLGDDQLDDEAIWEAPAPTGGGPGGPGGEDENARPTVRITGGELDRVVDEAESALMASGIRVYQRGGQLVRPVYQPQATTRGVERRDGALLTKAVEEAWLVETFTRAADFQKYDGRSHAWRSIDCPALVARTYLAREGTWKVPTLVGIIEAPTIRPDGTVLERPGYDEATGLLFAPGRTKFPAIAANPTREDALGALSVLQDLLAGFPFDAPHDFTIAVAAICTALLRRTLGAAPIFAMNAPKMGSGKSLIADVVSLTATGRPAAVMNPAPDAEEEAKRVLVVLMEGDPVAVVDNISQPWGSDIMCSVTTQETYKGRVLGSSKNVAVPTCVTWLATGNNLKILGDLTTRVLRCDLDPKVERPEERTFTVDLKAHIPANRGAIVAAALTILRAYHAAGRPEQARPTFGRFEVWQRQVADPLTWLGLADPCLSRGDLEAEDTVRTGLVAVLAAWHAAVGSERMTVKQMVGLASHDHHVDLRDALMEVAGRAGEINQKSFGKFLSRHEKRIEGGFRVEKAGGVFDGSAMWLVKRSDEATGVTGLTGDTPTLHVENGKNDNIYKEGGTNPLEPCNPCSDPADLEDEEL
jgi:hypothetical protein